MIRKLILSFVLATGAVTGLALTPAAANAAPPVVGYGFGYGYGPNRDHDHDHDRRGVRYEVLVRHRGHWDVYGTYRDRDDARRVAWFLERTGRDARIEVERTRW
ncbi:MAG: hypothetical protein C0467_00300 [Planctomycetaceae bacterium]|nr:hypothetical protein [Planctomycetaceae bacterium]